MKIAVIQAETIFENPSANTKYAVEQIKHAASQGADVCILPEMWNTGFFPHDNLSKLADKDGEKTKKLFSALAAEVSVNIIGGSIPVIRDGKTYNTSYVFDRRGECIASYDKIHLFSPSGEDKYFEHGRRICRFELDNVKCGIIICYDLRFPELARTIALGGCDVLFMPAQWPDVRISQMLTLAKARAIENRMFVCVCNSCGKTKSDIFGGYSSVIPPDGEIIDGCKEFSKTLFCDIDTSILPQLRNTMNVFLDRQTDMYKL